MKLVASLFAASFFLCACSAKQSGGANVASSPAAITPDTAIGTSTSTDVSESREIAKPAPVVLPPEDDTPLPPEPGHAGEIGTGLFYPMKSEPYRCSVQVRKAAADGETAPMVQLTFSEPCNQSVYRNVVFTCQANECDFAGRIRLHWVDRTQFTLSLSAHEAQESSPPVATTYSTRRGAWFTNVCNRGPIGASIVESSKSPSCDLVYTRDLAKILVVAVNYSRVEECRAGIPVGAFDGMLSLRTVDLSALTDCDPPVPAGAFRGFGSKDADLALNLPRVPLEALRDVHELGDLWLGINAPEGNLPAGALENLAGLRRLRMGPGFSGHKLKLRLEPGSFRGLRAVKELDFKEGISFAETLAGSFEGLEQLQTLSFEKDDLASLAPGALGGLNALEYLEFQNVGFTAVPTALLTGLPKLRILGIYEGNVPVVPKSAFATAPTLEYITLHSTGIESFDKDAFAGLPRLKTLVLNHNKLPEFPTAALRAVPTLTKLDFSNTDTKVIPADAFKALPSLTWLGFGGKIDEVQPGALAPLESLKFFLFYNLEGSVKSISRSATGLAAGAETHGIEVVP